MSWPASVHVLLVALTLGSCKLARNEEQTGRDLPPPEPAASYLPSKPTDLPAPTPRPRDTDRAVPRSPAPTPEPTTQPAAPPEPADIGVPTTDPPAPIPTATGVAGAAPALNANCLPKCQTRLQACVANPPALDGGLPSLESMAECRKAFDDCRQECGI
jgi:hypothetical protein